MQHGINTDAATGSGTADVVSPAFHFMRSTLVERLLDSLLEIAQGAIVIHDKRRSSFVANFQDRLVLEGL